MPGSRILHPMRLWGIVIVCFALSAHAVKPDSLTLQIDSAYRMLNAGKAHAAAIQAQTLNPRSLPASLNSHASRLALAGLKAQPGSHAWLAWAAKFDPRVWLPEEKPQLVEDAFCGGEFQIAASFLGTSDAVKTSTQRHQWEIHNARLKASAANWKETEVLLRNWKNNPDRKEGSGEVLFWMGWAALHQNHYEEADTLFALSSAYADESISQKALEYRYAMLADSTQALKDYINGLMESPQPDSVRLISLKRIPASSPLHPYALWEAAANLERTGDKVGEFQFLQELAENASSLPGRKASMRLARFQLEPTRQDSAMSSYEHLLLHYQQGVPSEFAKSRVQTLRSNTTQKPKP